MTKWVGGNVGGVAPGVIGMARGFVWAFRPAVFRVFLAGVAVIDAIVLHAPLVFSPGFLR